MTSAHDSLSATRSKLWWALALVAGLILFAVGGFWYVGQRGVESQLAVLKEKNLPTTGREVNDYYVVPAGVADTTELWVAAIDAVRGAAARTRGESLPIVGTDPTPVPAPGEAWTGLEAARDFVKGMEAERQTVLRAAKGGGQVRFPVDFSAGFNTLLPYTQEARGVARLLTLDAFVSAHDKNGGRALDDVEGIFALSDAIRGEPTIISQLVRIAIHVVGCEAAVKIAPAGTWNDDGLKSLQLRIEGARFKDEMVRALGGEQALVLAAMESLPLGPLRATNEREAIRVFERSIEANSQPWTENLRSHRALTAELLAGKGNVATDLLRREVREVLPALEQAAVSAALAEARQKCAVAIIALVRFRMSHQQLPKSLEELAGLIPEGTKPGAAALVDPFDGKPLRYTIGEKRVFVYSVGENAVDDGGDVDRDPARPAWRPVDLGFSIPK
jgi:hypothetical protein